MTQQREMKSLWNFHRAQNGWRLPLGQALGLVNYIETGMRRFRPQLYLGIRDEGFMVGLY
jgi:hypothetical protein